MSLEERRRKMMEAGIPMPVSQMPLSEGSVSAVPVTMQNADLHSRLQALKSGAQKHVVQDIIKSTNNGSSQQFQAIPEVRKGNKVPQVQPQNKVPVQSFSGAKPIGGEFAAMDAMYGGGNDYGYSQPNINTQAQPYSQIAQQTSQPELSVDQNGYGPEFNPQAILAKKRAQMQQSGNQYMQFAVQPEVAAQSMPNHNLSEIAPQNQQQFNFEYMQQMMQEIAKNTISEVLSSYTEKQKTKLTYENYTKTSDGHQVIKTGDGQFFKLVPVKIAKKS
jgi:hypothetical protein